MCRFELAQLGPPFEYAAVEQTWQEQNLVPTRQ